MNKSGNIKNNSRVNDRWIFIFVYPVLALMSVHVGNGNTFEELLSIPSYYSDVALAFLLTFGIGWYFRWLFFKLDQKFNWETEMSKWFIYQIGFGILLPIVLLIGIEIIYLEFILNISLADSSVLYLELPLVAVFCVLINLIYMILYFRKHHLVTTDFLKKQNTEKAANSRISFVVNTGKKSLTIPNTEIAYFIILHKSTFLVTTEGKRYLYDFSLDQINEDVNGTDFFQLNRQIIAHRQAIVSYERTETRKLKVEMKPNPGEIVFVSKVKASLFLNWLNQK